MYKQQFIENELVQGYGFNEATAKELVRRYEHHVLQRRALYKVCKEIVSRERKRLCLSSSDDFGSEMLE